MPSSIKSSLTCVMPHSLPVVYTTVCVGFGGFGTFGSNHEGEFQPRKQDVSVNQRKSKNGRAVLANRRFRPLSHLSRNLISTRFRLFPAFSARSSPRKFTTSVYNRWAGCRKMPCFGSPPSELTTPTLIYLYRDRQVAHSTTASRSRKRRKSALPPKPP
jgi:hypothetical protein